MHSLLRIFSLIILITTPNVYAAGSSGIGKINYTYHRGSDGLYGVYKVGGNWNNPDGCNQSNQIVIARDTLSRSEFISSILASKFADRDIQFYLSGCIDWNGVTYPKIWGLYAY